MNAATDWEENYIANLLHRRQRHGANFNMSEKELAIVKRIAGEDE